MLNRWVVKTGHVYCSHQLARACVVALADKRASQRLHPCARRRRLPVHEDRTVCWPVPTVEIAMRRLREPTQANETTMIEEARLEACGKEREWCCFPLWRAWRNQQKSPPVSRSETAISVLRKSKTDRSLNLRAYYTLYRHPEGPENGLCCVTLWSWPLTHASQSACVGCFLRNCDSTSRKRRKSRELVSEWCVATQVQPLKQQTG